MQNINEIISILSDIRDEECMCNEGSLTDDKYVELLNLLIELKEYVK